MVYASCPPCSLPWPFPPIVPCGPCGSTACCVPPGTQCFCEGAPTPPYTFIPSGPVPICPRRKPPPCPPMPPCFLPGCCFTVPGQDEDPCMSYVNGFETLVSYICDASLLENNSHSLRRPRYSYLKRSPGLSSTL
ncbi:unnamed protein product [Phyllotreta striolata]|uniref:Uncharacterized protein n=1 Tax=Phyllotreta striolata TaxID=444603 RepID=A0A9N9TKK4_PHYSR|nr:unnamed protein product [Phyllotreta striolata]